MNYLQKNLDYWANGYDAPNTEGWVFRPYGQVIKEYLPKHTTCSVVDWGCGAGGTLRFFLSQGMKVYGLDISAKDLAKARQSMPNVPENNFMCVKPEVEQGIIYFGGGHDLFTCVQSLYYLDDKSMNIAIENIYRSLKKGGLIYATMMTCNHYLAKNSSVFKNELCESNYSGKRLKINNYYINPTKDKEHLIDRFKLFEPLHTGFYSYVYRSDEEPREHFTFIGRRKA